MPSVIQITPALQQALQATANIVIPGAELATAEAWTRGSGRPIPESGYYLAEITEVSLSESGNGLKIHVALVDSSPAVNGFTTSAYVDYSVSKNAKKPEEAHATMLGLFAGFLECLGFPKSWYSTINWTPMLLIQAIAQQQQTYINAGKVFYLHVTWAKPPEGLQNAYGELAFKREDEWNDARATGIPPRHSGKARATSQAAGQQGGAAMPGALPGGGFQGGIPGLAQMQQQGPALAVPATAIPVQQQAPQQQSFQAPPPQQAAAPTSGISFAGMPQPAAPMGAGGGGFNFPLPNQQVR